MDGHGLEFFARRPTRAALKIEAEVLARSLVETKIGVTAPSPRKASPGKASSTTTTTPAKTPTKVPAKRKPTTSKNTTPVSTKAAKKPSPKPSKSPRKRASPKAKSSSTADSSAPSATAAEEEASDKKAQKRSKKESDAEAKRIRKEEKRERKRLRAERRAEKQARKALKASAAPAVDPETTPTEAKEAEPAPVAPTESVQAEPTVPEGSTKSTRVRVRAPTPKRPPPPAEPAAVPQAPAASPHKKRQLAGTPSSLVSPVRRAEPDFDSTITLFNRRAFDRIREDKRKVHSAAGARAGREHRTRGPRSSLNSLTPEQQVELAIQLSLKESGVKQE